MCAFVKNRGEREKTISYIKKKGSMNFCINSLYFYDICQSAAAAAAATVPALTDFFCLSLYLTVSRYISDFLSFFFHGFIYACVSVYA